MQCEILLFATQFSNKIFNWNEKKNRLFLKLTRNKAIFNATQFMTLTFPEAKKRFCFWINTRSEDKA